MSKYNFTTNQRFAVYKVFGGICQWCKEPLEFANCHIDHIIPEDLLTNSLDFDTVIKSYGLLETFDINNYENWIPSHPNCNQTKSNKIFEGVPILIDLLKKCEENKERAVKIQNRLDREPKKSSVVISIEDAIKRKIIEIQEIHDILLKLDIEIADTQESEEIKRLIDLGILQLADRNIWKEVKILNEYELLVTNGVNAGIVPRTENLIFLGYVITVIHLVLGMELDVLLVGIIQTRTKYSSVSPPFFY